MKTKAKIKDITLFGLPSRDQKKIIKAAAKAANKDQRDLIMEYNKSFSNLKPVHGCR